MPTLYHYSPLFHLAQIMSEGLWRGEVATDDTSTRQAVSLTTQTDPDSLRCWGGGESLAEKTAVRYACRIADDDGKLEPARKTWERLHVWKRLKDSLAPFGQAKWWYFYHGVITVEHLAVQFRGRGGYVDVSAEAMARILPLVAAEREKYETWVPPEAPWSLCIGLKDPDYKDTWLADETFPAERFGLG
jgi:hypothetical protein